MKLHMIRSVLVACCFLTATALFAAAPADTVTVGDFVVKLADTMNSSGSAIRTVDEAKSYFTSKGVSVPSSLNLSAPLTEMDVTIVSSLLGIEVTANEPGRVFDAESVDGFVGFLREEIETGRINPVGSTDGERNGPPLTISGKGACCFGTSCTPDLTKSQCAEGGGVPKGKGIPCSPDPCVPGKGACCVSGDCSFTFPGDCAGVFRGLNICNPGTCKGNKGRVPESPTEP